MTLKRYQLTTEEMLIFRDGKPFGEIGMFGGNCLDWPFAQTLAGMVRTRMGFLKSADFFDDSENRKAIYNTGIARILPMAKTGKKWQPLFWPPADLLLASESIDTTQTSLIVHPYRFQAIKENEGSDLNNRDWLLPLPSFLDKPATDPPFLFFWSFYEKYLKGGLDKATAGQFSASDIGVSKPVRDTRLHNALKSETLTTEEGKLYSNTGIYLKSRHGNDIIELSICFDLIGENQTDISGQAYLGGERKQVTLDVSNLTFPDCPDYFNDQQFLKIILTTHGDFGGWCPDFLQPDLHKKDIPWITLPKTDFKVRLRSACIDKWDAVSGIDYTIKDKRDGNGAKAMKKLVRPGAVYLIEIKEKKQSQEIARHLWGQNLKNLQQPGNSDTKLGYGQCIVGKTTISPTHCQRSISHD